MPSEVEYSDQFEGWWDALTTEEHDEHLRELRDEGTLP
jgi:hypothetical protein